MKKIAPLVIIILILALSATTVFIFKFLPEIRANSKDIQASDDLNEGDRSNLQQTESLPENEKKDPEYYIELASSYTEQKDYVKAINILQEGFDATGDQQIKTLLDGLKKRPDPPEASMAPGFYTHAIDIEFSSAEEAAEIFYTIDGSTPSNSSLKYSNPVKIEKFGKTVVKAIVINDKGISSDEISFEYDIAVQFKDKELEKHIAALTGKEPGNIPLSEIENINTIFITGECLNTPYFEDREGDILYQDSNGKMISRRGKIKSLEDLRYFSNLKNLTIRYNSIEDLRGLEELSELIDINLDYNYITDISALKKKDNLRTLRLGWNKIKSIEGLELLTNLNELVLGHNMIEDVSPLKGLSSLQYLFLLNNNIRDVSPLSGLTGLVTLNLWVNPVKNPKELDVLKDTTIYW